MSKTPEKRKPNCVHDPKSGRENQRTKQPRAIPRTAKAPKRERFTSSTFQGKRRRWARKRAPKPKTEQEYGARTSKNASGGISEDYWQAVPMDEAPTIVTVVRAPTSPAHKTTPTPGIEHSVMKKLHDVTRITPQPIAVVMQSLGSWLKTAVVLWPFISDVETV